MRTSHATQVLTAAILLTGASMASGQRSTAPKTVPISVDLNVGNEQLHASGSGTCTHAPQASIYDIRSQMWTAAYETDKGQSVQLTFWRPLDKSQDMFNLRANSANVSTVRKGTPSGSGTVTFEPAGKGGTFRVNAKAANGNAITGSIKCDAFLPHVAEGG
jgi:hypothetical protein